MNSESSISPCPSCGAIVPGGRPGCLKLFEEVLVRDYSDFRYGRSHRLLVDTYSLQHAAEYMRSGKSFAAHLTGICAALEYDNAREINSAVQQWLNGPRAIEKPALMPPSRYSLTIAEIHAAADPESHHELVQQWARSVWEAWADCHDLARQWIDAATNLNRESANLP